MGTETRRRLSLFLASWMFVASTAQAGPGTDARDRLQAAQRNARLTAHRALIEVINETLMRAHPQDALFQPFRGARESLERSFKAIRASIDGAGLSREDAEGLLSDDEVRLREVDRALDAYVRHYESAQLEARRALGRFRSAQARAAALRNMLGKIRDDLIGVCRSGIALNVDSSNLPAVSVKAPSFQMSFTVKRDYGDGDSNTSVGAGNGREEEQGYGLYLFPIFDGAGREAGEYNAAASYGTLTALYVAFGGFSATSLSAGLVAFGWAGGVTLVIAAALLLVQDSLSRQEGNRVANAIERVFWLRADADDVAREMKSACVPVIAALEKIPGDVALLAAEPPDAGRAAAFEERRRRTGTFLAETAKLAEARDREMERLKKTGVGGEDLLRRTAESAAGKAYETFVSEKGIAGLGEALAVNLTSLGASLERDDARFAAVSKAELEGFEGTLAYLERMTPKMRDRLWAMNRMRMQLSLERQRPGLAEALRFEASLNGRAIEVHREWQRLYAAAFRKAFLGLPSAEETEALGALLIRLRANPDLERSTLLKVVERRTESLLRFLQEARP